MGQRGSVRIESGSWFGYYNAYIVDEKQSPPQRVRKQKCVKLGPAEGKNKLSKFDAYNELARHIEQANGTSNEPAKDGSITLKQFAEAYWKPLRKGEWRPASEKSAEYILKKIYERFGDVALEEIEEVAVQKFLNDLANERCKSIVLHVKNYLKSIFKKAIKKEYIRLDPTDELKTPRVRKVGKDTLTPEQIRKVLAELKSPYDLLVKVALACALRPSELLALRWQDLDMKTGTFTIAQSVYKGKIRPFTKTTEEDESNKALLTVPVPNELVGELRDFRKLTMPKQRLIKVQEERGEGKNWVPAKFADTNEPLPIEEDNSFIFQSSNGNFMGSENILFRVFDPIEKKLGLKLNFQVLRRTAATLSTQEGSVKDVQGLLRHKSPDMTMGEYAQVIPESTRAMVNTLYSTLFIKEEKATAGK